MADSSALRSGLEEIFWSGFPEGRVPPQSPRDLAASMETFLEEQDRNPGELLKDPVAVNHLAYRLARPSERLDDEIIEEYCELAAYALRALAMAE